MVTKSPKSRILGKRRFKNINPRVHVQKLDENIVRAYQNRLAGISCNSNSPKEERSCFFTSVIDLNENEHAPFSTEGSGPCQCSYCSPYHEMKLQSYQQYCEAAEDQENVGPKYPYLCNVVQETAEPYPYGCSALDAVPAAPAPVVEKCDAETQTAPRPYRFTCKDCFSQFNNEHYYEQHVLVHRKLFECPFCNATFSNEKQLQSHVLLHMSKNFFECAYCSCVFATKKHLLKHISCHDKQFFECSECKAKFVTDKGLQNHKKSHVSSGKMIHVFRLAKAALREQPDQPDEPAVEAEIVETAEEVPVNVPHFFECNACHLRFSNGRNLIRHSVIHNRNGANYLHFCSVCGARFRANNHLVCHVRHAHKK